MNPSIRLLQFVLGMLGCALAVAVANAQTAAAPSVSTDEKKYIPYRIARGDRLAVSVFGESDLTAGGKRVEATGTVALTLIGEIRLVGLTILEAQALIENSYREGRYLRNPQVTVTVEESVPRWVAISGKINIPGKHEMPTDTVWTLKDLIIKAGGLQETASGKRVRILRNMPDGTQRTFEKDIDGMMRGRKSANAADASFPLEPEDIVYVPEKVI